MGVQILIAQLVVAHQRISEKSGSMVDILVLLILSAFFALAVLFVYACERIIGPDVTSVTESETVVEEPVAA
jgi:hypothetical protein